jgi:RHS repeat-associated protein
MTTILAGTGNIVENFSYTYDTLGNVLSRADANENNLTETFEYDALNRVTSATVSQNIAPVKSFVYDVIGNRLSKSDVGAYTYPASGANSVRPHAVSSISGSTINTTFAYDPNGNQTSGLGRSISYTSFNKPSSITQGSKTLFFAHDVEHQRFKQTAPEGYTYYFDAFGVHTELFLGAVSQWNDYLMVGGALIGVRILHNSDETVSTLYFHTDNLGSIAVITDESGAVVERDSYDAWGKRRLPTGADDTSGGGVPASRTTRGFTGQEELADVGLVHLNGRVYDPLVGRMMSADPMVPDPLNAQAWNRYSYVINNPLAFTDPNGYCFLGMCSWGHAVSTFFNRTFGVLFRDIPILGSLLEIAAVLACAPFGPVCMIPAAFASTTFVAGVTSGNLGYALKAGLIAAISATANFEIGDMTKGLGDIGYALNAAGRAVVGCASAVGSGGKCGPGALAAGVSALAGPLTNGPDRFASLVMNSVVGGLASVAGGGKFANGAVTGAFAYLFSPRAGNGGGDQEYAQAGQTLSAVGDRGTTDWYTHWVLGEPSPAGGVIVQEVTLSVKYFLFGIVPSGGSQVQYWEAWNVAPGQTTTDQLARNPAGWDDHFGVSGGLGVVRGSPPAQPTGIAARDFTKEHSCRMALPQEMCPTRSSFPPLTRIPAYP